MAVDTGKNIDLQWDGDVARLTLTRADKLNPLDWDTVRELKGAVAEIDARQDVFAVVVTGRGRSFSAGGDLDGYLTLYRHPDRFAAFLDDFYSMLVAIEASPKIYIAAVNGVCVAGGMDLILHCDVVVASDQARFRVPELLRGIPDPHMSARLTQVVGLQRARFLFFTADEIDAHEAAAMGLVGKVVPHAELDAEVERILGMIALTGPTARTMVKRDLNTGLPPHSTQMFVDSFGSPEMVEGMRAFLEKRPAEWPRG